MNSTSLATRELARRLIALESQHDAQPVAGPSEAGRVVEKLRITLARFAGAAGYRSLLMRAVTLAKAEAASLAPLQVQPDGSLQGFDGIEQKDAEAGVVVVACLLSLLVTFIGMPLTIRLVRDAWPDATLDEKDLRAEGQP
jgi:hypothetical protein